MEEAKRNKNKTSIPSSVLKRGNQLSLHQTREDDEQQQQKDELIDGLHSLFTDSRPKFSDSALPPVVPRHSRQNSTCSTQSTVRYAP